MGTRSTRLRRSRLKQFRMPLLRRLKAHYKKYAFAYSVNQQWMLGFELRKKCRWTEYMGMSREVSTPKIVGNLDPFRYLLPNC
jgi:hypothetical protein